MTWMVKEVSDHAELLTDGTRGIFFLKKKKNKNLLILYWDIAD